jgi:hypothetical protein
MASRIWVEVKIAIGKVARSSAPMRDSMAR